MSLLQNGDVCAMERPDINTAVIVRRLQNAKLSLIAKQPFYALLLIHMKLAIDLTCETAYTDGERIAFNPDYFDKLDDNELEFVLMHEVLHAALGHPFRRQEDYDLECYDRACDIVVNSNILYSLNNGKNSKQGFAFKHFKGLEHKTPSGKNGYECTVEQVYAELQNMPPIPCGSQGGQGKGTQSPLNISGKSGQKNKSKNKDKDSDKEMSALVASLLSGREKYGKIDPDADVKADEKMEKADDHSFWEGDEEDNIKRDTWRQHTVDSAEIVSSAGGQFRGTVPLTAKRMIGELKNPTLDWRTILNDFVQEEICDYSFSPPDKRMEDSPFFLPDFNEKDEKVKDILFMIDTSGSMSDEQITECYGEIYGAILQFGGKLEGRLGFFDAVVVEPIPFTDEEEFKIIRPEGGGGTSFDIIFDYVNEKMSDEPPINIIILTDGYAPFPEEQRANGIPVLWIINNDKVQPPWGKVARLIEKEK